MKLENLGYTTDLERLRIENNLQEFEMGRIIAEHKERYEVMTENGLLEAEITGNLRYSAASRADFPAVGDWAALIMYDASSAIIHQLLPRKTLLSRKAVGQKGEKQVIAANIDYAFIVQAVDRDFNINRLERYLTICYTSAVKPIIILSKTDLIDEESLLQIEAKLKDRLPAVPYLAISSEREDGYNQLQEYLEKAKTYCLLGSSGVGKSTLVNRLSGKDFMKTGEISQSTQRGKHVTSHRELIVLENGAILIDNPGMRELGIADASEGLETTFEQIYQLAQNCRFKDCRHISETGCAVLEALEQGEIDEKSYENFQRMEREKDFYEASNVEKRRRDKDFGKMFKNFKKDIKKLKG